MFEKIIENAKKRGIDGTELIFQSGHYYDGTEHGYDYPCAVFVWENGNTSELLKTLDFLKDIEKKYKLVKRDHYITPEKYTFIYTTKEHSEKANQAYGRSVCFLEGFWIEKHMNKNATENELIAAGHNSLIKHGYSI